MARVLHIEDDPQNRLLVRKLLAPEGHDVTDAVNGLEGIELARSTRPEIVLVDIQIPGLDGYEVILRLRALPLLALVPIVAITAEGDRAGSLAVGASGFVQKPIDAKTFARTVKRYLEGAWESLLSSGEGPLRQRSAKMVERLEESMRGLMKANRELEELARLRREYVQNVSHELSTPLTPVMGYVQMLLCGQLGPLSPEQSKALRAIDRAMARLRSVTSNLVDVSALESGRMAFEFREYDFASLAAQAIESVRPDFEEHHISLTVEPAAGVRVRGDADKVQRAMVHVLDNAAKFTPATGEVAVGIRKTPEAVSFIVADSGPGIAPTERERILETFYQGDGSATRVHGGVGLGLAFARYVCERHGGAVKVVSPAREEIAGFVLPGAQIELRVSLSPPAVKL